jgi:hypothetical protein
MTLRVKPPLLVDLPLPINFQFSFRHSNHVVLLVCSAFRSHLFLRKVRHLGKIRSLSLHEEAVCTHESFLQRLEEGGKVEDLDVRGEKVSSK